jgi:hypothetical protein
MSEYIATVQIQRSARGEGDVPMVVVAASGWAHGTTYGDKKPAIEKALEQALSVVRVALDKQAEVGD